MPHDDKSVNDTSLDQQDPDTRIKLLWDIIVFQLKLVADGFRDLVLVPISLIAALLGFVAGGKDPAVYFRQVLQFGRRTEIWINLFGFRRHAATSDAMLRPLEDKLMDGLHNNPTLKKAGDEISRSLDSINQRVGDAKQKREDD